ncbi:hypothetical protein BT96DRAFT_951064 [Gymnopus androsaceus JB14]|uniref:Uncharacterized protein n=1 Tax=Gymnopus androsaceus JB14 TaxID=1447944 RepID=A0A6A4GE81_9AGAR|nr:hypothetical protein BT96DRAFT_951064 [Gymnopus androsaceus JB14]
MTDSSTNQRNLRTRGPDGKVRPTSTSEDPNLTNHRGERDELDENAAALNRLLSPLPNAPATAGTSGASNQAPPQTDLRPISAWRLNPRSLGQPSNPNAASAELDNEGAHRNQQPSPRAWETIARSPTCSTISEDDAQRQGYVLARHHRPDSVPDSTRGPTTVHTSLRPHARVGTANRTSVRGEVPTDAAFPSYSRYTDRIDRGEPEFLQSGPTVHFEPTTDSRENCNRDPAGQPRWGTFVPDAVTDGASGATTIFNQCDGSAQLSHRQEKSRMADAPGPSGSRRSRSASPCRREPLPSGDGTMDNQRHLHLPAYNPSGVNPSQFALPPIAPLMDHAYQHGFAPQFSAAHSLNQGYAPPFQLPQLTHPGRAPLAPIQNLGWPAAYFPPPTVAQAGLAAPTHHLHTSPAPAESEDLSQVTRPAKKKASLADPCKAVVNSLANPFRSRTGGCNPKYAHELRHNKWTRWTPLGGFAPRFNSDGLSEALSSGDSLLLEPGAGAVMLKSKAFTEIPIEETDRSDFTGIAINFPRAIREHLIPEGETEVGSDHALAIAEMFQNLFRTIQDREDFHECFEIYREYVWRVIRSWHTYPEDNIRVDIFHAVLYQQILHAHLARRQQRRRTDQQ